MLAACQDVVPFGGTLNFQCRRGFARGSAKAGLGSIMQRTCVVHPVCAHVAAPASLADLKEYGRTLILDALHKTRGKIYGPGGAAALLGLKPTTLFSRVHRLGLKRFVGEGK